MGCTSSKASNNNLKGGDVEQNPAILATQSARPNEISGSPMNSTTRTKLLTDTAAVTTPSFPKERTATRKATNVNQNIYPLLLKGVSVHYLVNDLLQEVKDADLDIDTATVYDLEDLRTPKHGLIRRKGATVRCPRDHQMGAAYVDSIEGEDNVGDSNVMLSYAWGYVVKDIVLTLQSKCKEDGRDPKRTYVWICCLCNNQHRYGQASLPFEELHKTFYNTVTGVGTVWSMMMPWNKPVYLERIWCVFEVYVANTREGVKSEIIMSREQKDDMIASLGEDINNLFNALSNTNIENAEASQEEDKKNILSLVEDTIGYDELNNTVNVLLRKWISSTLMAEVEMGNSDPDNVDNVDFAAKLLSIGRAFQDMGSLDIALDVYHQCLAIQEKVLGKEHPDTALTYNNIGSLLDDKGEYEEALLMYRKSLAIQEKTIGTDHSETALTYNNIGGVLDDKGEYEEALLMYRKSLAIQEKTIGTDHLSTASTYSNIGLLLRNKGEYEEALLMLRKSLAIQEKTIGTDHPSTATTYGNIGLVLNNKGEYEEALSMFRKCLAIEEKTIGTDHADTATTYSNIGSVLDDKGEYEEALLMYRKCLAIQEKTIGTDHPSVATTYNNIARVKYIQGDHDGALVMLKKCLAIQGNTLGKDHPDTVNTSYGMEMVMKAMETDK